MRLIHCAGEGDGRVDGQRSDDSAERFSTYLGELANVIGPAARVGPLRDYCSGLLRPRERKSVEPIAAATAPEQTSAEHQLLHFLGQGEWSDEIVLANVRGLVLSQIERHQRRRAEPEFRRVFLVLWPFDNQPLLGLLHRAGRDVDPLDRVPRHVYLDAFTGLNSRAVTDVSATQDTILGEPESTG